MEEASVDTQEVQDAEMAAAFIAATVDEQIAEPSKAVEKAAEEKSDADVKPEAKEEPAPAPAPSALSEDQVRLLSAIPKFEQLLQRVDRVDGQYGEVKRLLEASQKAAATPKGAADFEVSADGDYLDQEFAEIAAGVQAKIDRSLSKVQQGITAEQVDAIVSAREVAQRDKLVESLDAVHPDRFEILKSAEWTKYLGELPSYRQSAIMQSQDLHYVSSELSAFKEHRDKQAAQTAKSKQRIEKAITPTGVRPSSPSTITEDEAMSNAFNAALTG